MGLREGGERREERRGWGKTKPLTQWENTTIQCRQDETNPVQHCPVKLAALYYSQLALSSSVVLVLFLKDNFTFHPLSSETLLKVPACYYEQKSSVNAEMLYPLLLPPCHCWILKHSIIKKENICWECSIPLSAASPACGEDPLGFAQRVPRGCCFQPPLLLLLDVSCPLFLKAIRFLLFLPPLSPLRGRKVARVPLGGQGRCHSEDRGKSSHLRALENIQTNN